MHIWQWSLDWSLDWCRKPLCLGFVILLCLRTILRTASARTHLAYAKTHGQTLASPSLTHTESSVMLLNVWSCFRIASTSACLELSSATASATFRYAGFSLRKRNSRTSPLTISSEVFDFGRSDIMRFLEKYDTSYKCGALVLLGWRKRAPTKSPSKNSRLWWDWVFVFDRCRFHWKLHRDVIETGWIFLWFFMLLPVKLWTIFDTARFGRNDIMRFLEKYDTSYKCGALVLLGWRKRAPTKSPSKNSRLWCDCVFVCDRCRFHWKLHRDLIETGWNWLNISLVLYVAACKALETGWKANEKAYWPTSLCMIVGWRNLRCSATVVSCWESCRPSGKTSFILSRVQCAPEKTALKFHRQACGQGFST